MLYRFALDARRLVVLVIGLVLVGGLTFAAGLLVGIRWQLGEPAETAPEPVAVADASALEPAAAGASVPQVRAPASARPKLPSTTVRSPVVRPVAPTLPPAAGTLAPGARGLASAAAVEATAGTPDEEPPPEAAATAEPDASGITPPTIYELQVGLFLQEEDSVPSIEMLAERGYAAYPVEVRNSVGKVLYTVRIGPFPTMEEAVAAMNEFTETEGLEAFVRFRRQPPATAPAAAPEARPPGGTEEITPGARP